MGAPQVNANSLISMRSSFGHGETMVRLETAIRANGMRLLGRIDYGAAAIEAGLALRPTVAFFFGYIRALAPLISAVQQIALDAPLKVLVWQDEAGGTWLSYDDPSRIETPRGFSGHAEVSSVAALMDAVARKAASPP
jgi:uncharacterized protein (DUF302 family)